MSSPPSVSGLAVFGTFSCLAGQFHHSPFALTLVLDSLLEDCTSFSHTICYPPAAVVPKVTAQQMMFFVCPEICVNSSVVYLL
jgi:hypothetical protein